MGITLDHWRKTHLALAILVTAFLVAGNYHIYKIRSDGSTIT